jgi:S1-C subfamily serine protease
VNIVCVSDDPSIPTISGSGVIIDSRGIILTAAHVAQFFLLQDYLGPDKVECIIRTGSPARRAYVAEPIYVSPSWVNANLTTLTQAAPKGTGENDFALLAITGTATTTPLASSFPAVPLASENPQSGEQVAIGSYGAQYLTSSELNYSLYPILVFGDIQNLFTFSSTNNTVDLVSVAGSAASQEGSSGGGIVNGAGELLGIITTSSVGGDISTRSLNAITIGHMRRSYLMDTGNDLDSVLASESLSALVANFAQESKSLGAKIVQNL